MKNDPRLTALGDTPGSDGCGCTRVMLDEPVCVPLCGAAKAYGRFDKPWHHEPYCPVRMAWEVERSA